MGQKRGAPAKVRWNKDFCTHRPVIFVASITAKINVLIELADNRVDFKFDIRPLGCNCTVVIAACFASERKTKKTDDPFVCKKGQRFVHFVLVAIAMNLWMG